ncbi:MAG: alpha/beta hydrolase [Phycisphaerales bacterium]
MFTRSISLFALLSVAFLSACATSLESREATLLATDSGIQYVDAGPKSNNAIVLVHGWASDHTIWNEQVEALREDYRVLAVDLPGHGGSARGDGPWSMAMMAGGITKALDHAGVRRAVLVGHSNGTPTIREFYRMHPVRTLGLVAVDGALRSVVDPSMMRSVVAMFQGENYKQNAERFVSGAIPPDAEYRELIAEMFNGTPQDTLVGGIEAQLEPSVWDPTPIGVPLLVINAEAPFWTADYKHFVDDIAEDSTYRTIPDASHFLFLDRPEAFGAILREWLESRDLP